MKESNSILEVREAMNNTIKNTCGDYERRVKHIIINGKNTQNMTEEELEKYIKILGDIKNYNWIKSMYQGGK